MNKKSLTGILAASAIASGCASIHPNSPEGQLTQYSTAAQKAVEMQNKEQKIEENPFNYTIEDLTKAYETGSFNNHFANNELMRLQAVEHDPEQFIPRFTSYLSNFDNDRIDNAMIHYAADLTIKEAKQWRMDSYWTEPLSLALWTYAFKSSGSSKDTTPEETIGGGSQDANTGDVFR